MEEKIWAEKYRPSSAEDYIFTDKDLERKYEHWLEDGVFPNMVLSGVQGTGKSTLCRILLNDFNVDPSDTMFVDGSVHNKVDDIREKVVPFTRISPMGDFRVVIFEESHRLSRDAQSALLETVERNSDDVRFIFTTNFVQKLLPPLISRCPVRVTFNGFDEEGVVERVAYILEQEGYDGIIEKDDVAEVIFEHIEAHKPDIRSIISSIQYSISKDGLLPPQSSLKSASIDKWEECWTTEDFSFDALVDLVYLVDNTNFESFYTVIYEKGLDQFPDEIKGEVVIAISEYLSKAMGGSTQGIQSIHLEALIHRLYRIAADFFEAEEGEE